MLYCIKCFGIELINSRYGKTSNRKRATIINVSKRRSASSSFTGIGKDEINNSVLNSVSSPLGPNYLIIEKEIFL